MSEEHYPGEADEAAADEASCMEPMTPHALTREQVKIIAGKIRNEYIWKHEVNYWLNTDAALRQALAQQAQHIEELEAQRVKYGPICLNCGKDKPCMTEEEANQHGASSPCTFDPAPKELWQRCKQQAQEIERLKCRTWNENVEFLYQSKETLLQTFCNLQVTYGEQKHEIRQLKGKLAAMTAERDEKAKALDAFEITLSETIAKLEASQARVKELEQPRITLAQCAVVDYLEKEVDQLLPLLGVEAALVTDLSHVGDFPDDQLGAEKYIWQAAIDLLRKQLATLQATFAKQQKQVQRYKQFVEWASTADSGVWAFQIREKAQRVLQDLE